MKKLLLLVLVFIGLKVSAQQTYFTPGVPPLSNSFSPTYRFKTGSTDSLNSVYLSIGNKWYQVYTAPQSWSYFDPKIFKGSGKLLSDPVTLMLDTPATTMNNFAVFMNSNGYLFRPNINFSTSNNTVIYNGIKINANGGLQTNAPIASGAGTFLKQNTSTGLVEKDTSSYLPYYTASGYRVLKGLPLKIYPQVSLYNTPTGAYGDSVLVKNGNVVKARKLILNNGLTDSVGFYQLGGTLRHNSTIDLGVSRLDISHADGVYSTDFRVDAPSQEIKATATNIGTGSIGEIDVQNGAVSLTGSGGTSNASQITLTSSANTSSYFDFGGLSSQITQQDSGVFLSYVYQDTLSVSRNKYLQVGQKFGINIHDDTGYGLSTDATTDTTNMSNPLLYVTSKWVLGRLHTLGTSEVPGSRTLTINGSTQDLSANRSWSVGTVTSVSGTTNRVTSTGGATPVIDISSTFEALLEKVANKTATASTSTTTYPNWLGVENYVASQIPSTPSLQSVAAVGNSYTGQVQAQSLYASGTGGNGYIDIPIQSTSPASTTNRLKIYADSVNRLSWKNSIYRRTIQVPYPSDYTIRMPYLVTGTTLEDSTHAAATYGRLTALNTWSARNIINSTVAVNASTQATLTVNATGNSSSGVTGQHGGVYSSFTSGAGIALTDQSSPFYGATFHTNNGNIALVKGGEFGYLGLSGTSSVTLGIGVDILGQATTGGMITTWQSLHLANPIHTNVTTGYTIAGDDTDPSYLSGTLTVSGAPATVSNTASIIGKGYNLGTNSTPLGDYRFDYYNFNTSFTGNARGWAWTNAISGNTMGLIYGTTNATVPSLTSAGALGTNTAIALSFDRNGVPTMPELSTAGLVTNTAAGILATLAGTTSTVLHGNASGLPTYGQIVNADITASTIDLTSKVTGILPSANGGTGVNNSKNLTVSNSLTLAGTDATTMTFPTTSATIARTDAANTFTGHQTIEGITSTGATGTGNLVFATSPSFTTPSLGTATSNSVVMNGSGANNLYVGTANGVTHQTNAVFLFNSQTAVSTRTVANGASATVTANDSYASFLVGPTPVTIPTGTSPWVANAVIATPNITSTGTSTNTATLFVDAAPSVGTNKYTAYFNTGNVQVANGNLTLGAAGNKINITTGSNASAGTGTLTGGTVTISTTSVTASSLIFLTDTNSSIVNVGSLTVSSKSAGTSFTVNSTNIADTSTFNWIIIN